MGHPDGPGAIDRAPPYRPPPPSTQSPNLVKPPSDNDVSHVVNAGEASPLPYLTPDAMLAYCQSRLASVNTQCEEIMTRQQKSNRDQAALGKLLSSLYQYQDGSPDEGSEAILKDAYAEAIATVGASTALGEKLVKDCGKWLRPEERSSSKEDMQSLINAVKTHQSEINSDSEIDMIRLQSLMSQRQTAVQLTTNIIQSLNDQANKIVANIGH